MKTLFLVEDINNQTAQNVLAALQSCGHEVSVISFFERGLDRCAIRTNGAHSTFHYNDNIYNPSDYDGVVLWCWGAAYLGRKYLRFFEDRGLATLNSSYCTEVTDSKVALVAKLQGHGIAVPRTVCLPKEAVPYNVDALEETLGDFPYVIKTDYGTQGTGVQFVRSIHEMTTAITELRAKNLQGNGILVQEFIGEPEHSISHYRVFVVGNEVVPVALKVSASKPFHVSNISAGGSAEFLGLSEEMKAIALSATSAVGLDVAGVDLMVSEADNGATEIVVLEVNDGPGTKTFDGGGYDVSRMVAEYFSQKLAFQGDKKERGLYSSKQIA